MKELEIEMTQDYDIFTTIQGNRKISKSHVAKLKEAMRYNDLFTPILVNEKLQVIDGQHRLEARRQLGFIVPYIVQGGLSLDDVQMLNSKQKAWNIQDYLESYIEIGKADYVTYKWFVGRYKFPHNETVLLLMNGAVIPVSNQCGTIFNSGMFKVNHLTEAKEFGDLIEQVGQYSQCYKHRGFIRAMAMAMTKKSFDFKTFLHRLSINPTSIVICANTDQYLDLIEKIYNFRSTKKVSLRYGD